MDERASEQGDEQPVAATPIPAVMVGKNIFTKNLGNE